MKQRGRPQIKDPETERKQTSIRLPVWMMRELSRIADKKNGGPGKGMYIEQLLLKEGFVRSEIC